jgi:hypothetical protein
MNSSDKSLNEKLEKLLKQLNISLNIVQKTIKSLDEKDFWNLEKLIQKPEEEEKKDSLDQLVCCARGLIEDIKHISSFIRGNIKLIFNNNNNNRGKPPLAPKPNKFIINKRPLPPLPLPPKPKQEEDNEEEEYDYDSLDYGLTQLLFY